MDARTQINASAGSDDVALIDALRGHLQRREHVVASRPQALLLGATRYAEQKLADEIGADVAVWRRLLGRAGELRGPGDPLAAKVILRGTGTGEIPEDVDVAPSGAVHRTPARYEQLAVTVMVPAGLGIDAVDGVDLGVPLLVEIAHPRDLTVTVYATDEQQRGRVNLGTLSRVVGDDAAYENRLSGIAADNGFTICSTTEGATNEQ